MEQITEKVSALDIYEQMIAVYNIDYSEQPEEKKLHCPLSTVAAKTKNGVEHKD